MEQEVKLLNPKLWQEKELIPEVKEKLLFIADNFVETLKEDEIDLVVKDIVIVGSNANFNYNETSDIDLHIIADLSEVEEEEEKRILCVLFNAYKSLFNAKYDIKVKDHEVEIYVEPEETAVQSGGIFSLFDGWIKEPSQEQSESTVEEKDFESKFNEWKQRYEELIAGEVVETNIEEDTEFKNSKIAEIEKFIEDLYELRKEALKKEGEDSLGNKLFKEFRKLGYLKNLKDLKTSLEEKEMSLESLFEEIAGITDRELFWHLRDGITDNGKFINNTKYSERAKEILEVLKGNLYLNKGVIDIYPNPNAKFVVSPEQYPKKFFVNKRGMLKFKKLVQGELIVFFNPEDGQEYGYEYSVITENEELCIKAGRGEFGKEFSEQEAYGKYVNGEYIPVPVKKKEDAK